MRPARLVPPFATLVAGAALVAAVLVAVPAPPAAAYPSDKVTFTGHGWGHGRGMGQYGALGYAVDKGRPYSWILDHYYGGTTKGSQGNGPISVRLVYQDGKDLIVTSGSPFRVGSNDFLPGTAARVEFTAGVWTIHRGPSCAGPWTVVQPGIAASARPEATTAYAGDDVNLMLRVCRGDTRSYRGSIMTLVADNLQRTVNIVTMEQYLRGVVPRESPASWGDLGGGRGMEALKAQAVAARSYAWAENRSSWAKTCDTVSCQVYGGAGLNGVRVEHANTDRAISQTAGEVRRTGAGAVARTEFSSSTGGWTAGGTFPAVVDEGDAIALNPNHNWKAEVPVSTVQAAYPTIGTLASVRVTKRNGLGADGGRVVEVRITGSAGSVTVSGNDVRSKLALKSDWFSVVDPVLTTPAVGIAPRPGGNGFWIASVTGEVLAFGDAQSYGSMAGKPLSHPIVGIAATPTGRGYYLVARDGGIFTFGDAVFRGSTGAMRLNQPIVGMAAHPSGAGYWLVASDGGIFTFGRIPFHGSAGALPLNQPVVGMAAHPSGDGYWLVARDGGVFSYGTVFYGSTGNIRLNQPIVGMTPHPTGRGYWFVAADGGVFNYGAAQFHGSTGDVTLPAPIVGLATTRTGNGYRLLGRGSGIYAFGDAR